MLVRWPIHFAEWTDFAPDGSLLLRPAAIEDTAYTCVDCEVPFQLGDLFASVDGSMSCAECSVMYETPGV